MAGIGIGKHLDFFILLGEGALWKPQECRKQPSDLAVENLGGLGSTRALHRVIHRYQHMYVCIYACLSPGIQFAALHKVVHLHPMGVESRLLPIITIHGQ